MIVPILIAVVVLLLALSLLWWDMRRLRRHMEAGRDVATMESGSSHLRASKGPTGRERLP